MFKQVGRSGFGGAGYKPGTKLAGESPSLDATKSIIDSACVENGVPCERCRIKKVCDAFPPY